MCDIQTMILKFSFGFGSYRNLGYMTSHFLHFEFLCSKRVLNRRYAPCWKTNRCTRKPPILLTPNPKKVLKGSEDHLHRRPPQGSAEGVQTAAHASSTSTTRALNLACTEQHWPIYGWTEPWPTLPCQLSLMFC
jgi:hypothetical protein